MSVILFILGILLAAAGIVAIGFGIPISEFNLGNTLIVAGTVAISAGLIIVGLAAAVDQLAQIIQALRPRAGTRPALQPQAVDPAAPVGVRAGHASGQGQDQAAVPMPPKAPTSAPRPPVLAQARAEDRGPEPARAESAPGASFSAIERLRSTLTRPERKASEPADSNGEAEDAPSAPPAAPAGPGFGTPAGANGSAPPAAAADARKKPPLDFLFRSKPREPQPEAFDAVWPKRGPRRPGEQADDGETARPATSEAPLDRPYADPQSASEGSRPPAILKSGVVDGMAYTLYADGSIEAQLPQGTVRFGSIAELRSHIENNS
jgi:hypothetical protein